MRTCGVQHVDRCWHMAAIAFAAQLLMSFPDRCSGFLYVGYMDVYRVDRQQAGWPQSVSFIVNFSAGLVVSGLQVYLSLRSIAMLGALLTWTGPIAASFAEDITTVTACMGFIHGLGSGIFFVAISISLMMYFDRYRGITSGIKNLGGTAASVTFPSLMLFIQGIYGFRACLLLYGGLAMHLTALGMLTKEPPWISRSSTSEATRPAARFQEKYGDNADVCEEGAVDTSDERMSHHLNEVDNTKNPPAKERLDIRKIFVNPVFYVIVLSGVIGYYTQNIFFATVVDFARDKGFSLKESASVMVYFGFTETVGRLCLPLAADRGLVRHSTLMAGSFAAMAASMILMERGSTLLTLTVGASLFAAFF
ncbi:monocarboxylate transporter 11-like [Dermacentor variabilis]|uniref:monocarboxylate transporter 11-like n=1 Tax=Dermacentor variabilis TaxID=34621 RepID=UPI003F5AFD38